MNYYEHHIGDYAQATAHLSFVEDAAYSRLIRKYYAEEKPLPADLKAVQRLVGARTREEKAAVEIILNEFFILEEDGWHNSRCDAEIARYIAGEPEREVKKANETNRLKRHREERAELFKRITDAGQHAPWNIGINELREMVKRLDGNAPATPAPPLPETAPATPAPPLPETAPATPATATQTPVPRHQYPDTRQRHSEAIASGGKPPTMTADEIIFGYGVPLLTGAGIAEKQARSFLGGLRKEHGDGLVIDKLRDCMRAKPLQPLEWLAAALPPGGGRRAGKQAQVESRNAAVVADWRPPEIREAA